MGLTNSKSTSEGETYLPTFTKTCDTKPDELLFLEFVFSKIDPTIQVIHSFDGIKAIALLKQLPYLPSFILLDFYLPRKQGSEVLMYLVPMKSLKRYQL